MSGRVRLWSLLAGLVAVTSGLLAAAAWLIAAKGVAAWLALGGALLGAVALQALVWLVLDWGWLRPAIALARDIQLMIHANRARSLAPPAGHGLGPLPAAIATLADHWRLQGAAQGQALGQATARLAEQQSRLEAVLRDLSDGIIACSADRRILLFNEAALALFDHDPELGLDRPLDRLIAREPIAHAFELLRDRLAASDAARAFEMREEFVCATADGARLLRCRMVLILAAGQQARGFVLDLTDVTQHLAGAEEAEVGRLVQALRSPIAALRAAAEVLSDAEALAPAEQAAFVAVLARESATLSEGFDALAVAAAGLGAEWPKADLFSADLVRWVERRLAGTAAAGCLTPSGGGLWLHGDGYHLAGLLARLVQNLRAATGAARFDLEVGSAGRRVHLDLVWAGQPLLPTTLESWLDQPLGDGQGALLLRDVLVRHDGELWSQRHQRPGQALLRLPLSGPTRPQGGGARPTAARLPPRPEFYDFALLERRADPATPLADRPLAELRFVVFDTETTGLDPAGGDRVIQIAGVRIVNRRLLTGETFDRLVDPGRPIPKGSIRFHGITDAMVDGRPPIEVVLPQFHAFAEGAVLVAHNAAFDMAFLRQGEAAAGVRFDHPVLDTLLLSAALHDHTPEHSLDAIAERFGITLVDRHQALGDAIGTAQLFLGLIDLLAAEGVRSLGDALALSARAVAVRRRQAAQFGARAGGLVQVSDSG